VDRFHHNYRGYNFYIYVYIYIRVGICIYIYIRYKYIPTYGLVQFPCIFPHISAYFRSHPWPPEVSTFGLIQWLFLPSFVAALVPLLGIWWQASRQEAEENLGFGWRLVETSWSTVVLFSL
jgi:hypothetical protein